MSAGTSTGSGDVDGACVFVEVPGLGPACKLSNGLYKVRHSDGTYGYTHGADPVLPGERAPGSDPDTITPADHSHENHPVAPKCRESGDAYYGLVIYARAHDDTDRFASLEPQLRDLIHQVNGHLRHESDDFGVVADYEFACVGGAVEIRNEVLPTDMASASFSTIVGDLRNQGYTDPKVKYWVWYDDTGACSCGGTGHLYWDDSASESNANNGNAGTTFAVTFGYMSVRIVMHENGHNLGAVQQAAPESSGDGAHCNDGQDIMCYADGGSDSNYDPNVCTEFQRFDCNKDTYYNPDPPAGSWLDTHWNIGHSRNRYISFSGGSNDAPVMVALSCSPDPSAPGQDVTCSFSASDADSAGVFYTVDWGDGSSSTRVPSSGTVAPGTSRSATHAWSSAGTYTVSVTATDDGGASSTPLTEAQTVTQPNQAPVMEALYCTPDPSTVGEQATCWFYATDPDSAGVHYTVDWGDGSSSTRVPSSGTTAPGNYRSAVHAWSSAGSYTVTVTATDDQGATSGSATYVQQVNEVPNDAPVMVALSCSPDPSAPGQDVTCSFSASDADSAGVFYTVDWGDGSSSTRVPSSGTVAPGTSRSATHAWSSAGTYTVAVTATDDGSPPGSSAPRTLEVTVREPPCLLHRTGTLSAGMGGTEVEGVSARDEAGIPEACWGHVFQLSGAAGSDFDVTWYQGATVLSVHDAFGPEADLIPAGADRARIIYKVGVAGTYTLTAT